MSREGKLVKNTAILSIGTFLPKAAAYFTLPILTGVLTKEEYGTYDLVTVLVSLLLPAVTLQIQTAIFRFLIDSRKNEKEIKQYISTGLFYILCSSAAALIILFFALFRISVSNRLWILLYFLADILVNATRQISRGLNNTLDYSISAVISALFKLVFVVLFVEKRLMGLTGAIAALALSSIGSFIFLFFKIKLYRYIDTSEFSKEKLKEMLSYSWPMVPNNMSMWAMKLSNRLIITAFLGVSAQAVFGVANKIPNLLTLAQNTFSMAWHENASIYAKDKDASQYYSKMYRTMYDLMAGILGLLISATPVMFAIFIRGDYLEAYNQMPIIFLALFFSVLSSFLGGIYVAFKKTKSVGIMTIYAAICNIIVNLLLIKPLGLYSASIAMLVSYVFLFVIRTIDIRKIAEVRIDYKHVFLVLAVILAESVICFQQSILLNYLNAAISIVVFVLLNKELILRTIKKALSYINY